MTPRPETSYFESPLGHRLAYTRIRGEGPVVLWLGGFLSDRSGSKASALQAMAAAEGWNFLSFDHFVHGESTGDWDKARIGGWIDDAVAVVDSLCGGPVIPIGSSMGAWIGCALIAARPDRIVAAGFLAPAPDFTHELMLPALGPEARHELDRTGSLSLSGYDRPVALSQAFFDEALGRRVLNGSIAIKGPVRILHGLDDEVVPWAHAVRLMNALKGPDVTLTLIKDGDHRLSRPQDISMILEIAKDLRGHQV